MCRQCIGKLSPVRQPVCCKCGKALVSEREEYCTDCKKHRRTFEYGRALLEYNDAAAHSMAQIKYHNKREYLDFYSEAIWGRYEKVIRGMEADALVPVPVHASRLKVRGFNQAQVLAEKLSVLSGIPVMPHMLERHKKTVPQRDLTAAERLKNLEEAFLVGEIPLEVNSVILIDDIYTTGSTIEACARVLKQAGISRVYFLTICIGCARG